MPHPTKTCPKCGASTRKLRQHYDREHKPKSGRSYHREANAIRGSRTRGLGRAFYGGKRN